MNDLEKLVGTMRARRITKRHFPEMHSAGNTASINHAASLNERQLLEVQGIGLIAVRSIFNAYRETHAMPAGHTKLDSACLQKAKDDEPIFVLRGQDLSSPRTVLLWMADNVDTLSDEKLQDAFESVLEMKHYHKRKRAD